MDTEKKEEKKTEKKKEFSLLENVSLEDLIEEIHDRKTVYVMAFVNDAEHLAVSRRGSGHEILGLARALTMAIEDEIKESRKHSGLAGLLGSLLAARPDEKEGRG